VIRVSFICNDNDVINKFRSADEFNVEKTYMTLDDALSDNGTDLIIISDRTISINELVSKSKLINEKFNKVYYMVSSENLDYNTKNILNQYGINMIPPKYTVQRIFEFICTKELNFVYDNNIVVFFGADNKVGTTMIAQTIAEIIAKNTDKKVLLAFMCGFPGTDYIKGKFPGNIDELKPRLLNKVLSESDIIAECRQVNNLYILEGVNNFLYRNEYLIEDVEVLLNVISENFDVVILDAGSNIELALCLGSLNASQNRFLVTTPQRKAFDNFQIIYDILYKLNISNFSLIINKFLPEFGQAFEIADKYKFNLSCTLPYLYNGWQAELDRIPLYYCRDKNYCANMDILAEIVSKSVGIDLKLTFEKKNLKYFFKRRA